MFSEVTNLQAVEWKPIRTVDYNRIMCDTLAETNCLLLCPNRTQTPCHQGWCCLHCKRQVCTSSQNVNKPGNCFMWQNGCGADQLQHCVRHWVGVHWCHKQIHGNFTCSSTPAQNKWINEWIHTYLCTYMRTKLKVQTKEQTVKTGHSQESRTTTKAGEKRAASRNNTALRNQGFLGVQFFIHLSIYWRILKFQYWFSIFHTQLGERMVTMVELLFNKKQCSPYCGFSKGNVFMVCWWHQQYIN